MPYFPVDDQAAFHPKFVLAGNAAIGLWARAGSWAKNHATGGFIPSTIATSIGTRAEIKRLVLVGLWEEVLGGYLFHDWDQYGANKTGAEEEKRREARRMADRERQRRHREKQGVTERDSHGVTEGVTLDPVPSPVPVLASVEEISPVLEVRDENDSQTEEGVPDEIATRAHAVGVDLDKVRRTLAKRSGHLPAPESVLQGIVTVVNRAKPRKGDRTGLVLRSINTDWAEWERILIQGQESA